MKPIIYFDFKESQEDDNLLIIDKKRLQEIFDEVYQAGYVDGAVSKQVITTTPWVTPSIIDTTPYCDCKDTSGKKPPTTDIPTSDIESRLWYAAG